MCLSKNKIIAAMLAALTIAPIATQSYYGSKKNTQQSSSGSASDKNDKERNNKDNNSKKGMSTGAKVFLSALFIFYGVPILYSNHTTYNKYYVSDDYNNHSIERRNFLWRKELDLFFYMFGDGKFSVFDFCSREGYLDLITCLFCEEFYNNTTVGRVRNILSLIPRYAAQGLHHSEEWVKFKLSNFFGKDSCLVSN